MWEVEIGKETSTGGFKKVWRKLGRGNLMFFIILGQFRM
jgi:hypothetical protein